MDDITEMGMVRTIRSWSDAELVSALRDPRRAIINKVDAYMTIFAESLARILERKNHEGAD